MRSIRTNPSFSTLPSVSSTLKGASTGDAERRKKGEFAPLNGMDLIK